MTFRALLAVFAVAALGSTASAAKHKDIALGLSSEGDVCTVLIGAKSFTSADEKWTEATTQEVLRLTPDKEATIHLSGSTEVPYRCIGGLILALQDVGYSRFGFVTEPSPTSFDIKQ